MTDGVDDDGDDGDGCDGTTDGWTVRMAGGATMTVGDGWMDGGRDGARCGATGAVRDGDGDDGVGCRCNGDGDGSGGCGCGAGWMSSDGTMMTMTDGRPGDGDDG